MRILLITPYPPQKDGIGDYSHKLARSLLARGHEIAVITPREITNAPSEVIGSVAQPAKAATATESFNPDIVHLQFAVAAFGSTTPSLMRFLGRLAAPLTITFHEVTRDTRMLGRPGRALYRAISRHADAAVTHTEPAEKALRSDVGIDDCPVHVIAHPSSSPPPASVTADDLRRRYDLEGLRVILAFGFIHVDKGLDDLVRAFALLRSAEGHEDVRLAVAGDVRGRSGPFRIFEARDRLHLRAIRRDARRLGASGAIIESGYVPSGEVRAWLDIAEVLALPYTSIEQSGVASMAAAAGTPMLVSDVGTLAQHFGDQRWMLPTGDSQGIAAVLDRYLAAGGRSGAMQRSVVGADMESVVEATEGVYEQTIAGRRGAHAA